MYSVTNHMSTAAGSFEELVRRATRDEKNDMRGVAPYPYQVRIAEEGFPDLIQVPTGSGKTMAAVLPWLFRRLHHPDPAVRSSTPRRLVMALPTRALIAQTTRTIKRWLMQLGLHDTIVVYEMMGGGAFTKGHQQQWRLEMHRPTIVVGTLDMIVSRCLVRGYGVMRGSYAIDFALLVNGSHIVVDEIQLVPQATATLRQIAAYQRRCGTAEPSGLTVMSATVDDRVLDTVDNPFSDDSRVIDLGNEDRSGPLAHRLSATRTIRRLSTTTLEPRDLAEAVLERHVDDTLTLVVVNTVDTAIETYTQLRKLRPGVPALLIHSRFRAVERSAQLGALEAIAAGGGVVVSTQCIEAGVDIDARTLVTEVAPWSSIIQRAGRCNRAGALGSGDAVLWWLPGKTDKTPYADADLDAARSALDSLEGEAVTSGRLKEVGAELPEPDLALRLLRWRDFEQLFDTTADLSGSDIDISVYIRPDEDERDVQLAWVPSGWVTQEEAGFGGARNGRAQYPPERLRCQVGIRPATDFVKREDVTAWVFDQSADAWVPARSRPLRPHDLVLVLDVCGGYSTERGFDPKSKDPVDPAPPQPSDGIDVDAASSGEPAPGLVVPETPSAADEAGGVSPSGGWVELGQHLAETAEQARALADVLDPPGVSPELRRAVYAAAALHDVGKAHPDWQQALREANPGDQPAVGTAYAKSPGRNPLRVHRVDGTDKRRVPRAGFRHELVTLFMLSTQAARDHLERLDVPAERHDLVRYLTAAHHGLVRMSARDAKWDGRDGSTLLGCRHDEATPSWRVDAEHELPTATIDLGIFKTGRSDAWSDAARSLLAELGPFRLGYLETLVRMADWRSSAGLPLAGVE